MYFCPRRFFAIIFICIGAGITAGAVFSCIKMIAAGIVLTVCGAYLFFKN